MISIEQLTRLKNQFILKNESISFPNLEVVKQLNSFGYNNTNIINSIFSSNIEGNSMDINSYFNFNPGSSKTKEKSEIDDLAQAYDFAMNNQLNEKNFLKAHKIISSGFLEPFQQGKYKTIQNGLFGTMGLIYLAAPVENTSPEMKSLFELISTITPESDIEILFYSSMFHMILAHIHPFADGNGRSARLLQKWYLAKHVGVLGFHIPLEEFYKKNRDKYYKSLNLGPNYFELNYDRSKEFCNFSINVF